MPETLVRRIENARALDRIGEPVGAAVAKATAPSLVKSALAGSWLGHPVHPVLTDLPIGAWMSSLFLDLFGGDRAAQASDRLLGLGVLAALPTAVTGLSDWADTGGKPQRVGVVHAAGNLAAVALYSLSLMARWRGRRRAGLALSALGAGMMTFGAYLGGHLAYRRGVGVDQTTFEEGPADWVGIIDLQALPEEKPRVVSVEGTRVLLYRSGDSVYGISDRCGHRGCALHEGFVDNHQITCPCHGSTFRLRDGSLVRGPATAPQPAYQARLRDGRVEVRRPPD